LLAERVVFVVVFVFFVEVFVSVVEVVLLDEVTVVFEEFDGLPGALVGVLPLRQVEHLPAEHPPAHNRLHDQRTLHCHQIDQLSPLPISTPLYIKIKEFSTLAKGKVLSGTSALLYRQYAAKILRRVNQQ
jgi:hypothetical protein